MLKIRGECVNNLKYFLSSKKIKLQKDEAIS